MNISKKMVLGTAQFGMDYGIANLMGKPTRKDVLSILALAWEKGVRRFDTAPGYGNSEHLLGEENKKRQDKIIIATGSKPAEIPGIPIDKKRIITSTEALNLPGIPKHLILFLTRCSSITPSLDPISITKLLSSLVNSDSRIPNMERPVNGDKACVSLVFQGTNKGYTPESTDDVVEEIDYSEVDFSEVK